MELSEHDIKRLASFPEQNPNPVIELLFSGLITYCNPAAKTFFPDLASSGIEHPLFIHVRKILADKDYRRIPGFKAEVNIGDSVFEQKLFLFGESDIIRVYSSDITEQKKTEKKLEQLALFPIQNPNPVMELDAGNMRITFKNPAAKQLFPNLEKIEPTHPLFDEIGKRLGNRQDFTCEVLLENKYFEKKVFFIPGTELVRIYLHDLTERKRTERNLARLATFPEQNPNPIVELNLDGEITYTNLACQNLFPGILEQTFTHELLIPFRKNFRRIVSGEISDSVEEIKAGSHYYIQRARLMKDMGLIRVFNTDITAQKHSEEIIREKNKEITDSINYAKRIQFSLLPSEEEISHYLQEYFILFLPKDIVSGDFYWFNHGTMPAFPLKGDGDPGDFYFGVCDSTGHGVPGSLMSILNTNFLNEALNEKKLSSPNEIFDYVRHRLTGSISKDGQKDGFDGVLLKCGMQNDKLHAISYAAAHNAPVLVRGGEHIDLPADKMPVGKGEREAPFSLYDINFRPGDMLYLFTDGYADQFGGPKGKKFKYKQLLQTLVAVSPLEMVEQKRLLKEKIEDWRGTLEQVDDICVVGIRL